MAILRSLVGSLFVVVASGVSAGSTLYARDAGHTVAIRAKSFMRSLEFKRTLRVCNAYPYALPLDVWVGRERVTEEPLPYRMCGDYAPRLKVGDQVDFKVHNTSAGTFTINDLPQNDAILLMVIYRHDSTTTAVAFESHIFANSASPQVAVLDTYKGKAKSELRIQDVAKSKDGKDLPIRSELLRYDNVVAIDPGLYEVVLTDPVKKTAKAKAPLVALQHEAYIVVRCGVEAAPSTGESYPEELIVFPHSDKEALGGAASARPASLAFLFTVLSGLALVPSIH